MKICLLLFLVFLSTKTVEIKNRKKIFNRKSFETPERKISNTKDPVNFATMQGLQSWNDEEIEGSSYDLNTISASM